MPAAREIKRRIKSINNTKKITKAMELVSAAKMRKSVNRVTSSRPYSGTAWQVLDQIALKTKLVAHPLLKDRLVVKSRAAVVISSNRGLCGAFNSNIADKASELAAQASKAGQKMEFITFGKKGRDNLLRSRLGLAADFIKDDITSDILKIVPLVRLITTDFINGKYDQVDLIYTDFVSTLTQRVAVKKLLPLKIEGGSRAAKEASHDAPEKGNTADSDMLYEPGTEEILNVLLPRILEVQIYQAVLESEASEHSARMLTMRNASDAAGDIISDLTLSYNQARQSNITREIAEISAGKIALEK